MAAEEYVRDSVPEEVFDMLKPLVEEMDKLIAQKVKVVTVVIVEHAGESSLGVITNVSALKAMKIIAHGHAKLKQKALQNVLRGFFEEIFEEVRNEDKKKEGPNGKDS